jgi:hypothetical protein
MMTVRRQGVAPSPKGQKYEDQEVVKRSRGLVEDDLYTGRKLSLPGLGQPRPDGDCWKCARGRTEVHGVARPRPSQTGSRPWQPR